MFRELTRKSQQISSDDCIRVLTTQTRGVLSVQGEDGYPYGTPMNHFYNPVDGCVYFHCGKTGHRLDMLRQCDKVSFCVYDQGTAQPGHWALQVKSVIVFGRTEIIDDQEQIADITTKLSLKFTQDKEYIQREIDAFAHETLLLRLVPEHMCGKRVTES